jgi:UrcA family protein
MKTALILIATAAAAFTAPAFAAPVSAPSIAVHYTDLNLASEEGTAALDGRIQRAADRVCGRDADNRDLTTIAAANACRKKAIAGTATQVAEAISAAHRDRAFAMAGGNGIAVSR